jgi:hypothetical protein
MEGELKDSSPMRGVRIRSGRAMMRGPFEIRLDLHAMIDTLLLLKSDLQVYYAERGDAWARESRRYQIAVAMRQVSERIVALEDVVMHVGCPVVVTVGGPGGERLRCAVQLFDRYESIDEDERFEDVLVCVTAALNAADVVCLRAAGGRVDVRADAARIERPASSGVVIGRIGPSPEAGSAETQRDGTPTRYVSG